MVKNAVGGNKSKKLGRKHVNAPKTTPLRLAKQGEFYACVTKICGNRRFYVITLEGIEYMCHMGNKFAGRFKRDNTVTLHTWILVGEREWESQPPAGKRPNCDLLEVYNAAEVEQLRTNVDAPWHMFPTAGAEHGVADTHDELHFVDEPTAAAPRAAAHIEPETQFFMDDQIINIDDI